MKTKEEVIKEAYGSHWDKVKKYVDQNGWLDVDDYYLISNGLNFMQIECDHTKNDVLFNRHRPIELKGLEDNNGWIKIESEEDLPPLMVSETEANRKMYEACFYDGDNFNMSSLSLFCHNLIQGYRDAHWTHYREYVKPKPPIY